MTNPTSAPPSPDSLQLRGAPASSARVSRKAALAAVAILGVLLGVIIINVSKDKTKKTAEEAAQKKDFEPALNAAKSLTKDVPDVITPPVSPPAPLPEPPPPALARVSAPPPSAPVKSAEDDARLADTAVPKFAEAESTAIHPAVAGWSAERSAQAPDGAPNPMANDTLDTNGININTNTGSLRPVGNFSGGADAASGAPADLNHQDEKLAFQRNSLHSAYLDARLTAPRSPFELKTGTVIPGILVGAMNSDLPGEIVAQVSQNVYDTASGEHLLIPQGTRLYGRYDSKVTFGQGRLLVSWQRLIYPNAYTLELGAMSGHDQGGNAGFTDQVNNHYARIFGWALLTSVISAGAQLSQPQQTNVLTTPSSGQVAAAAVGQEMAQVGSQMAARNMQIQPTIQIRKGYRFTVMVNKDILFPGPYQP
jgi:type IV secretion system protein VirB10